MTENITPNEPSDRRDATADGGALARREQLRRRFRRGFLLGLPLLLLTGEIAARIHYAGEFPSSAVWHPRRGHAHRPGWEGWEGKPRRGVRARFNSLGLRDDRELERRFAGRRIAIVGDSVAFGYRLPAAETIARRVEARLQGSQGEPVQVVNVGCYGYGVGDARDWLTELAPKLELDRIVLVLCHNDFAHEHKQPPRPSELLTFARDRSGLVFALARKLHQLQRSLSQLSGAAMTPTEVRNRFRVPSEEARAAGRGVADEVLALVREAEERGARVGVVLWPGYDQVAEERAGAGLPPEHLELERRLGERTPGLPLVLMQRRLSQVELDAVFLDHCHPSAEGSRRIAEAALDALAELDRRASEGGDAPHR